MRLRAAAAALSAHFRTGLIVAASASIFFGSRAAHTPSAFFQQLTFASQHRLPGVSPHSNRLGTAHRPACSLCSCRQPACEPPCVSTRCACCPPVFSCDTPGTDLPSLPCLVLFLQCSRACRQQLQFKFVLATMLQGGAAPGNKPTKHAPETLLSKGSPSLLHGHRHCCRPSSHCHERLQPLRVPLRGRCRLCLPVSPHRRPVLLVVPHEHIYGWRLSAAAVGAAAARLARCLLHARRCCGAALPSWRCCTARQRRFNWCRLLQRCCCLF